MRKMAADFRVLGAVVLLPVVVLAGVAVWGLGAQRRAALADAQGQARAVAQRMSGRLEEGLAKAEMAARFTAGIRMPVPPEKIAVEEMALLHAGVEGKKVEVLKRLAWGEEGRGKSEAGLPVFMLAALAGLELDPLAMEFHSSAQVEREPSVLTEKWLQRLEEAAGRVREPAAGELSVEHPYYLCRLNAAHAREYWEHDEWVRRAFWDGAREEWKTREAGAHVMGEEVFWVCRPQVVTKYSRSPQTADAMAVLTEDDLGGMIGSGVSDGVPEWMGVSVLLENRALHVVPKHRLKGVSLVWNGDGPKRVVEGMRGAVAEWLEAGGGEVLASERGIFTVVTTLREPRLLYGSIDRMAWWAGWMLATAVVTAATGLWLIRRVLVRERRLGELKSQFVSSVSHELRAPVGSLRLMAEGLASGRVTGEGASEFHRLMAGEGARLSALIENVLDFARIEQGRKSYQMRETDVAALLGDAVGLMRPQAEAKGLRIELACERLPEVPRVDAGALQQAVINLLDNAIKFTAEGAEGVIGVGLAADGMDGGWSVAVTDPGMGIAEAEQGRIFELFYRLGNELRRETTGTGIGLAIVKHIVEGHGGEVVVTSELGRGSCFRLRFPGRRGEVSSQEEVDKGGGEGENEVAS